MSDTRITQQDIDEIIRLLQSAEQLTDFRMKYGDFELSMSRADGVANLEPAPRSVPASIDTERPKAAPQPAPMGASDAAHAIPAGMAAVKAPMVGTFYRAPSPGAKPFIEVGTPVEADTVVGIIEVMKLMNSLSAGVAGTVRQILVEDSKPVGFGQALVLIEPNA